MADSFQEKTEQPTEKRREDARKKGQVAQSPELASCFVLLFISIFLYFSISKGFNTMFAVYANNVMSLDFEVTPGSLHTILSFATQQFLVMVTPIFLLLIAIGVFSSFIQTGFMWSFEALTPKLETLNPMNGIKKLFSMRILLRGSQIRHQDISSRLHSLFAHHE